jgi:hypothetical protein
MKTRKKRQLRSDLPYIIKYAHQIHLTGIYSRNKATYKGGRGTWDALKHGLLTLIKVIFLVVLKCNKIQKCILPCENLNFVTKKFRDISYYFAIRNFAKQTNYFAKQTNYFAKYEINISRNFATEKFRRPP